MAVHIIVGILLSAALIVSLIFSGFIIFAVAISPAQLRTGTSFLLIQLGISNALLAFLFVGLSTPSLIQDKWLASSNKLLFSFDSNVTNDAKYQGVIIFSNKTKRSFEESMVPNQSLEEITVSKRSFEELKRFFEKPNQYFKEPEQFFEEPREWVKHFDTNSDFTQKSPQKDYKSKFKLQTYHEKGLKPEFSSERKTKSKFRLKTYNNGRDFKLLTKPKQPIYQREIKTPFIKILRNNLDTRNFIASSEEIYNFKENASGKNNVSEIDTAAGSGERYDIDLDGSNEALDFGSDVRNVNIRKLNEIKAKISLEKAPEIVNSTESFHIFIRKQLPQKIKNKNIISNIKRNSMIVSDEYDSEINNKESNQLSNVTSFFVFENNKKTLSKAAQYVKVKSFNEHSGHMSNVNNSNHRNTKLMTEDEGLFCRFYGWVLITLHVATVWIIVGLQCDKFLAITVPLRYNMLLTKNRIVAFSIFTWSLALVSGSLPLFVVDTYIYVGGACLPAWHVGKQGFYVFILSIVMSVIPFTIILLLNVQIVIIAKRHQHKVFSAIFEAMLSAQAPVTQQPSPPVPKKKSSIRSVIEQILAFVICYVPIFVVAYSEAVLKRRINYYLEIIGVGLFLSSPLVNSFLYGAKCKALRRTFGSYLRKRLYRSEVRSEIEARCPHSNYNSRRPSLSSIMASMPYLQKTFRKRRMSEYNLNDRGESSTLIRRSSDLSWHPLDDEIISDVNNQRKENYLCAGTGLSASQYLCVPTIQEAKSYQSFCDSRRSSGSVERVRRRSLNFEYPFSTASCSIFKDENLKRCSSEDDIQKKFLSKSISQLKNIDCTIDEKMSKAYSDLPPPVRLNSDQNCKQFNFGIYRRCVFDKSSNRKRSNSTQCGSSGKKFEPYFTENFKLRYKRMFDKNANQPIKLVYNKLPLMMKTLPTFSDESALIPECFATNSVLKRESTITDVPLRQSPVTDSMGFQLGKNYVSLTHRSILKSKSFSSADKSIAKENSFFETLISDDLLLTPHSTANNSRKNSLWTHDLIIKDSVPTMTYQTIAKDSFLKQQSITFDSPFTNSSIGNNNSLTNAPTIIDSSFTHEIVASDTVLTHESTALDPSMVHESIIIDSSEPHKFITIDSKARTNKSKANDSFSAHKSIIANDSSWTHKSVIANDDPLVEPTLTSTRSIKRRSILKYPEKVGQSHKSKKIFSNNEITSNGITRGTKNKSNDFSSNVEMKQLITSQSFKNNRTANIVNIVHDKYKPHCVSQLI